MTIYRADEYGAKKQASAQAKLGTASFHALPVRVKVKIPPSIDWRAVCIDIGKSANKRVCALTGRSREWWYDLRDGGTEPRYSDGVVVIEMWKEATGKDTPPLLPTQRP